MLIDGGPDGMGDSQVLPLMRSLGITQLDYMIASHYHVDHIGGLDEVARVFPPGVAYDRGGIPAPSTSQTVYRQYTDAVGTARRTITPGTIIELGGGAIATCIVVAGRLISGGEVPILGRSDASDQLENSASIGILVQYKDFDFLVCGDLTGGGINTTDVETTVAQLVGDVDVVQLNHHGSRTASNRKFLQTLRAEVGVAQMGSGNTFLHPTIETTDRFVNTTPTSGQAPQPPDRNAAVSRVPFVLQNQPSPSLSSVSHQGLVANGNIEMATDGMSYTISGGALSPVTLPEDGAERGVRRDFPPTIVFRTDPTIPLAGAPVDLFIQASDDAGIPPKLSMSYTVDGGPVQALASQQLSERMFKAIVPGQPDGVRVELQAEAIDAQGQRTVAHYGYFSGTTPIARLRINDSLGEPVYLRFPAKIAGVVTVATGSLASQDNDVYVQDETGGINVVESGYRSRNLSVGDRVTVIGRLNQSSGETVLDATDPSIYFPFESPYGFLFGESGPAPIPIAKRIAELDESAEGLLVRIEAARIVGGSINPTGSSNLTITDGTGSTNLRIESTTGIPGMATPNQPFSLVGVVGQFDSFRPFDRFYEIRPRTRSDIIGVGVADQMRSRPVPPRMVAFRKRGAAFH